MEVQQGSNRVRPAPAPLSLLCETLTDRLVARRSLLPDGLKTKKWEDRMEKTKKEQAIKKLQAELKDEKLAEIQRCARARFCLPVRATPASPPISVLGHPADVVCVSCRRKEITMERKKAAEERRRLEEEKAKVRIEACALLRGRGMLI